MFVRTSEQATNSQLRDVFFFLAFDCFCDSRKGPFTQAIFVEQLNAICVALKLQLQYRTCKPAVISARF